MKMLNKRGFTLLEILVVTVIMGLVVTAAYSVFLSTQRTTYTSEEVVEVQQNLRVSLDWMARDIRMAGFLVAGAITVAPPYLMRDLNNDGDFADANETFNFSLNTSASNGRIARIDIDPPTLTVDPAVEPNIIVASPEMVDLFDSGEKGDFVRIVRPATIAEPLDRVFRITGKDRDTRRLTLSYVNQPVTIVRGDLIVWVGRPTAANVDPNTLVPPPVATVTITYRLEHDPGSVDPTMMRLVRNASDVVANKITAVDFTYFTDDGIPIPNTAGREDEIRTVRIAMTGATDATRTGQEAFSGVKTRQIETIVKLRNF